MYSIILCSKSSSLLTLSIRKLALGSLFTIIFGNSSSITFILSKKATGQPWDTTLS